MMVFIYANQVKVDMPSGEQDSPYNFIKNELFPKLASYNQGQAFKIFWIARNTAKKENKDNFFRIP